MKALWTFLSAVAIAVVATAACTTQVLAQSPLATTGDTLVISVQVDEAGGWTAYIGDDQKGISADDFGGLMKMLGMEIPNPTLDPSMVKAVTDSGVASVALIKDGQDTTVLVNNAPVSAMRLSDAAVSKVTDSFMPELEGLVSWLNSTKIALVAYFPGATGSDAGQKVTLDTRMPTGADGTPPANVIQVGATFAPDGELVSVGGVSAAELGLPAGQLVDLSGCSRLASLAPTCPSTPMAPAWWRMERNGPPCPGTWMPSWKRHPISPVPPGSHWHRKMWRRSRSAPTG